MIRFECPHCGKGLRTGDDMVGQAFNCPDCRGRVRVPAADSHDHAEFERKSDRDFASSRFAVHPVRAASPLSGRLIVQMLLWALALGALGAIGGVLAADHVLPGPTLPIIGALLGVTIGTAAAFVLTGRRPCPRCRHARSPRSIGTIERDGQSAQEALEAGDLAALRALTPEGDTIDISVTSCRRCGKAAPMDVLFAVGRPPAQRRELAHVTYPGAALPIFERLCRKSSSVS